jgi:hypothetical protein
MRKVLAALCILIMVSGSLVFEPQTIVVVSNSIDYSSELVQYLEKSFDVIHISAEEFSQYQNYQFFVILGGPDAPEGIGEIIRNILPPEEQEYIRAPGTYSLLTHIKDGKTFFVLAGSHREQTKRAVIILKEEITDQISEKSILWLADSNVKEVTDMTITDLDNDSVYDYVFACRKVVSDPWMRGAIYVYEDSQLQWYYHLSTTIKALTCYDLDSDGEKEIIVACDILRDNGDLYVFDMRGNLEWRRRVPGSPRSLYCYETYVGVSLYGQGERVMIFDFAGEKIRDLPVDGSISTFIIEDINQDGSYELVVSGILNSKWEHFLVVYDLYGNTLWNYETSEHINDFEFCDIDGDGIQETILACYDSVHVIRGGDLIGRVYLPPALLKVQIVEDQLLLLNSNTLFLIDLFLLATLNGQTVPFAGLSQMVHSHLRVGVEPKFLFLKDIDSDDFDEIVVGNGEILEIHEFADFVPGVEGFVTVPVVEVGEIPPERFLSYENSTYLVKIDYFETWTVEEPERENVIVLFSSPLEGSWDTFQENVNIVVEPLSEPMTLDDYTELSINQLEQSIEDFQITEEASATLAGNPAYKIVFAGKMEQYSMKWMQIWTIKDDKAYIITYTALLSQYPIFLGTVQHMVNSVEILERAVTITICEAQFDAPGDDNENLNEEWVRLCNNTDFDIDMTGWGLMNNVGSYYEFPDGFILKAGSFVIVYTGVGANAETALYWGRPLEAWNNAGDVATLIDNEGDTVDEYEWIPE